MRLDHDPTHSLLWFPNEIRRKVGNGVGTSFWHEQWFGNSNLKVVFPRLFSLSEQKEASVEEMGWWDGDVWRWRWHWRRIFFLFGRRKRIGFSATLWLRLT